MMQVRVIINKQKELSRKSILIFIVPGADVPTCRHMVSRADGREKQITFHHPQTPL